MKHTKHSLERQGQRGFTKELVGLILDFGSVKHVGSEVVQYQILNSDINELKKNKSFELIRKKIDLLKKKAVLVANGTVVTLINIY